MEASLQNETMLFFLFMEVESEPAVTNTLSP
jgi:hypothetical protein